MGMYTLCNGERTALQVKKYRAQCQVEWVKEFNLGMFSNRDTGNCAVTSSYQLVGKLSVLTMEGVIAA